MIKGEVTSNLDGFDNLKKAVKNRALRDAMRKALKPIKASAKSNAPRKTGSLAVAMGSKQNTFKSGTTVGLVGPKAKFTRTVKGQLIRPVKYAHLVEKGTVHSQANPFLERANETGKQQFIQTVIDSVKEVIAKNTK